MNFNKISYENDMEILVTDANLVTFSDTVISTGVTADAYGKKYVKAGSLIDADGKVVTESATTTGGTAGVYTLTISTPLVATDTITINGVVYEAVASNPTGNQFIPGSTATDNATALLPKVQANESAFNVTASGATLVFTQKVNGVGAIPVISVVGTGAASIAETTAGVLGTTAYALSTTPVGILYRTIDVTNGDQPAALIVEGYLRKDRVIDDLFDNTISDINTALPNIKFR